MRIFYSPKFLEHSQGFGHPESPERLEVIMKYLKESDLKYEKSEPRIIDEKELLVVHSKKLINEVKRLSHEGAVVLDNRFDENTFDISRLAAGAALQAAEHALAEKDFGFALVRPPGHHAGKDSFGGFCYFNNLALAVRKCAKKTVIVDVDVHFGNGTEDIFYDDKNVFYLSLHQYPLYPGGGLEVDNNEHVLNVPLPPGINDSQYLSALENALGKAREFKPELVAISVGFDTFVHCPIANFAIEKSKTYFEIGKKIQNTFSCPKFACLEGGYYLPKLGENVYNFLKAFE
jgi:acetoin utilization deacetylase AcuC-like enzyme